MKQGEIWLTNLNPIEGSEQAGVRPVVIVSGNALNDNAKVVWCCPLTTQIKKYHGNLQINPSASNGLQLKSEVLTLHLISLSKSRLKQKMGSINLDELKVIHNCMNDILKY
jgi:mRNA interferase MazF